MNAATLPASAMPSHRRALLLILALALLPIVIGGSLHYFGWRPDKTSNHGTLVTPPVALGIDSLKGKWSLVLVADAPCGPTCAARIDELRRVRVSLAKEWKRTQHLGLDARPTALADLPAGTVVIVDPNGLAMMRYVPGADANGIRADLERLLKYSWIG
ncbi:MAG: hypothetical protein Q8O25_13955 [Sulfurisoma sp.]|nr:hypothetical protein [Sulfurisoma sp.]